MAPAAAEPEEGSHGTFRARCTMYGLLSAFEMTNYVTRLAIPYIVTFMVRDFSFSEQQRALLLNSFTPGYILTQIPAGWAIQRWGTKPVVSVNSLGIVAIMLSLPTVAARGGARAACACLILFGEPFIASIPLCTICLLLSNISSILVGSSGTIKNSFSLNLRYAAFCKTSGLCWWSYS